MWKHFVHSNREDRALSVLLHNRLVPRTSSVQIQFTLKILTASYCLKKVISSLNSLNYWGVVVCIIKDYVTIWIDSNLRRWGGRCNISGLWYISNTLYHENRNKMSFHYMSSTVLVLLWRKMHHHRNLDASIHPYRVRYLIHIGIHPPPSKLSSDCIDIPHYLLTLIYYCGMISE